MLNLCSWSVLNIQFRIWTSTCANSGMISVYQIWLLLNFAALKWFRCFLNCACRQVLLYAQVRIQRWENKPGAAIVTSQWSWCDLLFVLLSLTFLPGSNTLRRYVVTALHTTIYSLDNSDRPVCLAPRDALELGLHSVHFRHYGGIFVRQRVLQSLRAMTRFYSLNTISIFDFADRRLPFCW